VLYFSISNYDVLVKTNLVGNKILPETSSGLTGYRFDLLS
jgi:hypothetical protein